MRSKRNVVLLLLAAVYSNCGSGDSGPQVALSGPTDVLPSAPVSVSPPSGASTARVGDVQGLKSGIYGYSGNPDTNGGATCSNCHFGGVVPVVTLSGPIAVVSGTTNSYMLEITGGQQIGGGLDVSVTKGTLVAVEAGTEIMNGEVIQTTRRDVDGTGAVSWLFDWTAPPVLVDTEVTMYGAGLSANGSGTSGDGTGTHTLVITVQPGGVGQPPLTDAGGPYLGAVGVLVQFDGSGSTDPDGSVVAYDWDFGDGNTGTGMMPMHTYNSAGMYDVTLTVTDNDGLQASDNTTVDVSDPTPATPSVLRFRVPKKVNIAAGRMPTKTLAVTAAFHVPSGEVCGTVFLMRNGGADQDMPICFTAGKPRVTMEFEHTFTPLDAPVVEWTTYVEVNGVESSPVTELTDVSMK